MNRNSLLYKVLRNLDSFQFVYRGLEPDFDQLDFLRDERKLFSDKGLIRARMTMLPGTDMALVAAVKELGGWDAIMQPSFVVTEEVYSRLERAGFSREQLDKSREFNADPSGYRFRAQNQRYPST